MEKLSVNDVLVFDTETTGIPAKGLDWEKDYDQFPHVVQLAWSYGDKIKSYIIRPDGWTIPEETAEVHGITNERAAKEGKPFDEVVEEFLADANNAPLICAHNIYFDVSILKADILRVMGREFYDDNADAALYKGKRIDTMYKTKKFVGAKFSDGRPGKFPRLEELYAKLFDGETFPAHDAGEDVKALKRCLPPLVEMALIELKVKEYPEEENPKEQPKPKKEKKITFEDSAPVELPGETKEEQEAEEPTPEKVTNELLNQNDF